MCVPACVPACAGVWQVPRNARVREGGEKESERERERERERARAREREQQIGREDKGLN